MKDKITLNNINPIKGVVVCAIASIIGTLMMDLVIVLEYAIIQQPLLTHLAHIGSVFGGGVLLGVVVYIIVAVLLGLFVSIPLLTIRYFRIDSMKRGVVIGTGIGFISIIACIPMAILIEEKIITVLIFMFIPHVVWGLGLGLVVGYGLPSITNFMDIKY